MKELSMKELSMNNEMSKSIRRSVRRSVRTTHYHLQKLKKIKVKMIRNWREIVPTHQIFGQKIIIK